MADFIILENSSNAVNLDRVSSIDKGITVGNNPSIEFKRGDGASVATWSFRKETDRDDIYNILNRNYFTTIKRSVNA